VEDDDKKPVPQTLFVPEIKEYIMWRRSPHIFKLTYFY